MAERTPVTACTSLLAAPSTTRLSHGRRHRTRGSGPARRRAEARPTPSSMHGAPPRPAPRRAASRRRRSRPACSRSGRSTRQRANACGHRGLKAQPAGMALSRGIEPSICGQPLAGRRSTRWDRAHQAPGVRMRAAPDHVAYRTDLDNTSGIHHLDPVTGFGDDAHVVRDEHHRRATLAAQPFEERDDLRLDRHIQRRGGPVGDQQLRPRAQRERHHHPLAHATGELVRVVVDALLGTLDPGSCSSGWPARSPRRPRIGSGCGSSRRVARRGVERVERGQRVLEDRADVAAAYRRISSSAGCRCAGLRERTSPR